MTDQPATIISAQINAVIRERDQLRAEVDRLQRENASLARTYAACERLLRDRTEENTRNEAMINELRAELEGEEQKSAGLDLAVEDAQRENKRLTEERDAAVGQRRAAVARLEKLSAERGRLIVENNQLQAENTQLRLTLSRSDSDEMTLLRAELERLRGFLKHLSGEAQDRDDLAQMDEIWAALNQLESARKAKGS